MSNPVKMLGNITERAVLIGFHKSVWTATKKDKEAIDLISQHYGSDSRMSTAGKKLLVKESLDKISKIGMDAYNEHMRLTLPWKDDGRRILSSIKYEEYMAKMRDFSEKFNEAKQEFIAAYPSHIEEAKILLNGRFRASDYPTVNELNRKFRIEIDIDPVGQAEDFRVALSDTEVNRVKADFEAKHKQLLDNASQDIVKRLKEVVERMVERLTLYKINSDGKVENKFHDTLVSNIQDILALIPAFNHVLGNQTLDELASEISVKLTTHSPDVLRENEATRQQVRDQAQEVLDKLAAYI